MLRVIEGLDERNNTHLGKSEELEEDRNGHWGENCRLDLIVYRFVTTTRRTVVFLGPGGLTITVRIDARPRTTGTG